MYKRAEARSLIFQAWREWPGKPDAATGADVERFFKHLETEKPALLQFRGRVGKCQDIHGWLVRNGDVSD